MSNAPQEFLDNFAKRIEENQEILKEDPKNRDAQFEVAFGYQQIGEYRKAIKEYEKVLKIATNDYATLNNLADIYEKVGEPKKAIPYITQLFNQNTEMIEPARDTVRILLKAGQLEAAKHAIKTYENYNREANLLDDNKMNLISELNRSILKYENRQ